MWGPSLMPFTHFAALFVDLCHEHGQFHCEHQRRDNRAQSPWHPWSRRTHGDSISPSVSFERPAVGRCSITDTVSLSPRLAEHHQLTWEVEVDVACQTRANASCRQVFIHDSCRHAVAGLLRMTLTAARYGACAPCHFPRCWTTKPNMERPVPYLAISKLPALVPNGAQSS